MYHKILIPLDGSEAAEAVIPHAEVLARNEESRVVFCSAIEPAARGFVIDPRKSREVTFEPQGVEQTDRYLTRWKERFEESGIAAETLIVSGTATKAIAHAVEVAEADLLAMTTRGRVGFDRLVHGSVAAGVFARLRCPMLLVGPREPDAAPMGVERILVPLDGTRQSEEIVPQVVELARLYRAEIVLVRVVRTAAPMLARVGLQQRVAATQVRDDLFGKLSQHEEVQRVEEARQYLLNWQARFKELGFSVQAHLLYGRPVEGILRLAEETQAGAIAMTCHGKTGLEGVLYGSVAASLLYRSSLPLFLARVGDQTVDNFA